MFNISEVRETVRAMNHDDPARRYVEFHQGVRVDVIKKAASNAAREAGARKFASNLAGHIAESHRTNFPKARPQLLGQAEQQAKELVELLFTRAIPRNENIAVPAFLHVLDVAIEVAGQPPQQLASSLARHKKLLRARPQPQPQPQPQLQLQLQPQPQPQPLQPVSGELAKLKELMENLAPEARQQWQDYPRQKSASMWMASWLTSVQARALADGQAQVAGARLPYEEFLPLFDRMAGGEQLGWESTCAIMHTLSTDVACAAAALDKVDELIDWFAPVSCAQSWSVIGLILFAAHPGALANFYGLVHEELLAFAAGVRFALVQMGIMNSGDERAQAGMAGFRGDFSNDRIDETDLRRVQAFLESSGSAYAQDCLRRLQLIAAHAEHRRVAEQGVAAQLGMEADIADVPTCDVVQAMVPQARLGMQEVPLLVLKETDTGDEGKSPRPEGGGEDLEAPAEREPPGPTPGSRPRPAADDPRLQPQIPLGAPGNTNRRGPAPTGHEIRDQRRKQGHWHKQDLKRLSALEQHMRGRPARPWSRRHVVSRGYLAGAARSAGGAEDKSDDPAG